MDLEDIKDVWGKEVTELLKKKLFLFDMDGTIYEEERVFDGTRELLALIKPDPWEICVHYK